MTTYSGRRRFLDQGRYVWKSREDEGDIFDLGEKTELVMNVESLDTYRRTAEVSQSLEGSENIARNARNNIDNIVSLLIGLQNH